MPREETQASGVGSLWPEAPPANWGSTCATLHRWVQVVGKVRLALTPWVNHSWHATLYVTSRGLTTSPIPYGRRAFQIDFDFLDDELHITSSDGPVRSLPLVPQTVAAFYGTLLQTLDELDLSVRIHGIPNEVADAIPFQQDEVHREYDAAAARQFWRILVQVDRVFKQFRTGYLGKVSPVHLFWGAFDLAVTRFSGRRAPLHPGRVPHLPDDVAQEAYSHEVSSAGFWPGGSGIDYPAFYSYAYPEPEGFVDSPVRPREAFYEPALGEFILPYEVVRSADEPDAVLLSFLQSTYEAAATLGAWDRAALECPPGRPGVPRVI